MSAQDCTFPECGLQCECVTKQDMWAVRAGRHSTGPVSTMKRLELENARLKARIETMEMIINDYRQSRSTKSP